MTVLLTFLCTAIIAYLTHRWAWKREKGKLQVEHERLMLTHQREDAKGYHDRRARAAAQISDNAATVRWAGLEALANLADEFEDRRSNLVDDLCRYLRVPWNHEVDEGEYEVRRALVGIFKHHLRGDPRYNQHGYPADYYPGPWSTLDLDFRNATFAEADFEGCVFGGDRTNFHRAVFSKQANFDRARFVSAETDFDTAQFLGEVQFHASFESPAEGESRSVTFGHASFAEETSFAGCRMGEADQGNLWIDFTYAEFRKHVSFDSAKFNSSPDFKSVSFLEGADFSDSIFNETAADFRHSTFGGRANFMKTRFQAYATEFDEVVFHDRADFWHARFDGARVSFADAKFAASAYFYEARFRCTKYVVFNGAVFEGDTDFDRVDFCDSNRVHFKKVAFSASLNFGVWTRKAREFSVAGAVFPADADLGWASVADASAFTAAARPPDNLFRVDKRFKDEDDDG